MNNEIKEIFRRMNDLIEHQFDKEYHIECDLFEDIQQLLDYITNLQEENKKLKEIAENLTTMTVCGDRKQIKNTAQYKLEEYKSRLDKAIEYMEQCRDTKTKRIDSRLKRVLNILKGE